MKHIVTLILMTVACSSASFAQMAFLSYTRSVSAQAPRVGLPEPPIQSDSSSAGGLYQVSVSSVGNGIPPPVAVSTQVSMMHARRTTGNGYVFGDFQIHPEVGINIIGIASSRITATFIVWRDCDFSLTGTAELVPVEVTGPSLYVSIPPIVSTPMTFTGVFLKGKTYTLSVQAESQRTAGATYPTQYDFFLEVQPKCAADFNGDHLVDDEDFVFFVQDYNRLVCADVEMMPGCAADLDANDFVDDQDFVMFVAAYEGLVCSDS